MILSLPWKKIAENKTAYFFILGNVFDLESGLCDQMSKVLFFQLAF